MRPVAAAWLLLCAGVATAAQGASLTVTTLNFACRDVAQLAGCDNIATRFGLLAEAFRGESPSSFTGVPNLSEVDVILAQELGTSPATYAQVSAALALRGFAYDTGAPAPTASDPMCSDPPSLAFDRTLKAAFSALTGLASGGLVVFSKHPIRQVARQNWCSHGFSVPAGYLGAMICLLYTSPSPRDRTRSRMPSSA